MFTCWVYVGCVLWFERVHFDACEPLNIRFKSTFMSPTAFDFYLSADLLDPSRWRTIFDKKCFDIHDLWLNCDWCVLNRKRVTVHKAMTGSVHKGQQKLNRLFNKTKPQMQIWVTTALYLKIIYFHFRFRWNYKRIYKGNSLRTTTTTKK